MSIADFVAIYAAIVATTVLIWNYFHWRKHVRIKIWKSLHNDVVFVTVKNETKQPLTVKRVGFSCLSHNSFSVPFSVRHFGNVSELIETREDFIDLVDGARCVFWLAVEQIKECHRQTLPKQKISHVFILDHKGTQHKRKIPKKIKKLLLI